MLPLIDPELLEQELLKDNTPILLAFFEKIKMVPEQTEMLQNLASSFGHQLRVYLGDESYLNKFYQSFDFQGTPFYLLLSEGQEKNRFYGTATNGDLIEIIKNYAQL